VNVDLRINGASPESTKVELERVRSSQEGSALGRRDRPHDIRGWSTGTTDRTGRLRAESWGKRLYTLEYSATDPAGNSAECATTVTVGKNNRLLK
jgi:hypothetical protein